MMRDGVGKGDAGLHHVVLRAERINAAEGFPRKEKRDSGPLLQSPRKVGGKEWAGANAAAESICDFDGRCSVSR
jgi:hypothetical protein